MTVAHTDRCWRIHPDCAEATIVLLSATRAEARDAIARVRVLHAETEDGECGYCCADDGEPWPWPCPTWIALEADCGY